MTIAPEPLTALVRELADQIDPLAVYQRVVAAALDQLDGAEHAGITLLKREAVSTPAATSDLVRQIDERQYERDEGPCLTAARDQQPIVVVSNLATDERWPAFREAVIGHGVHSMLSFQLFTDADTIGALNIYAAESHAFGDEALHVGYLLAAHAAASIATHTQSSNLRLALNSRDVIGQAKGILMERYKITAGEAFDLLIAASQRAHVKLNNIAADLAASGELRID